MHCCEVRQQCCISVSVCYVRLGLLAGPLKHTATIICDNRLPENGADETADLRVAQFEKKRANVYVTIYTTFGR